MNAELYAVKYAWIRDNSVPAGLPAQGRIQCPCGTAPLSDFKPEFGNVTCGCGTVFTWDGYIIFCAVKKQGESVSPRFNRNDICAAYLMVEHDYETNGMLVERPSCRRRNESVHATCKRIGYKFGRFGELTENAWAIYDIVEKRLNLR